MEGNIHPTSTNPDKDSNLDDPDARAAAQVARRPVQRISSRSLAASAVVEAARVTHIHSTELLSMCCPAILHASLEPLLLLGQARVHIIGLPLTNILEPCLLCPLSCMT